MQDHDDSDEYLVERPNKSQLKREMQELQDLGVELVKLPAEKLAELDLPEKLVDAIELARRITSHGAQKRQRQYIGGLLAKLDDVKPIRDLLERQQGADKVSKARFQENERWRERLINEGDGALAEFLERHPEADRQHLRRLVREAAQEAAAGRPPRHARELFRYLQTLA
ncbi:MAG TPA: ribosome biogenesis factor YjgA [Gammaproteobacteria bacterium]|jgi:ribosome-associated protein|nr:ribosome biogenesis factor YjgA [Gammaproteobacteria bacterium]